MGFYINKDKSLTWRGPMLSSALKQIYNQTKWGDLDYLIIDMPPGTGDAYLTIANEVNPDGSAKTAPIMALNETGKTVNSRASVEVPENGNYRFVFIVGTHDKTGGLQAGADMLIDNIVAIM